MTDRKLETFPRVDAPESKAAEDSLLETETAETVTSEEEASVTKEMPPKRPNHGTPAVVVSKPLTGRQMDELTLAVERVLEENMSDAYHHLSPIAQQEFKLKGEQTARAIRALLTSTRLKVKKIFHLILQWLKMLPGINRFFLEQEAKIKTDRILSLERNRNQKSYAVV